MSKTAIPHMLRCGCDVRLAAGSLAALGTAGIIIPPSTGMTIYAVLTETSVGKLFAAGILRGTLAIVLYSIVISIWVRRKPELAPMTEKGPLGQSLRAMTEVWGLFFVFGVVMGGIFCGFFAPAEGGAMGAFTALVIGIRTRTINWEVFVESIRESFELTTMEMTIIVGVSIFEFFVTSAQFPQQLNEFIQSVDVPNRVIVAGIIAFPIVLGGFWR